MNSQIEQLSASGGGELVYQDANLNVNRLTEVSVEEKAKLWRIIQEGFAAINARSTHRQDMELNEFDNDIENPKVLKYIANNGSDIVGYLSVHVGLDQVTWVPSNIIQIKQDEIDKNAESYYISTFVVEPSAKGTDIGSCLLRGALIDMAKVNSNTGKNGVAFFDCAEANHPFIPNIAKQIADELSDTTHKYSVEYLCSEPVDPSSSEKQYYYSVTFSSE